ncbi:hypothetical protein K505DRAFT_32290 [Melanomma pulvis-pyrius CBS 109.77]|uniref:Uncharacterized protein n=1 Tax=Melanomma pulvis-pyrius CBS 109.77 TaxID=1314802 RepID=A0A6A6XTY8_9PLEO|nr:hypothetical protein K505DRAFT_32290 [Melanomma pulvis-pyrius CBS 109.77]
MRPAPVVEDGGGSSSSGRTVGGGMTHCSRRRARHASCSRFRDGGAGAGRVLGVVSSRTSALDPRRPAKPPTAHFRASVSVWSRRRRNVSAILPVVHSTVHLRSLKATLPESTTLTCPTLSYPHTTSPQPHHSTPPRRPSAYRLAARAIPRAAAQPTRRRT